MQHHSPHKRTKFEGYFTRFDLPSGASLALVVCSVPKAETRKKHIVSLRYVPPHNGSPHDEKDNASKALKGKMFQVDLWLKQLDFKAEKGGFRLQGSGYADDEDTVTVNGKAIRHSNSKMHDKSAPAGPEVYIWATQGSITYSITDAARGIHLKATSQHRVPWSFLSSSALSSTPAGLLAYLPLPLHWHVHSLASETVFTLSLPEQVSLAAADRQGTAIAHEEKNWANGFPKAHVWALGRAFSLTPPQLQSSSASIVSADRRSEKVLESSLCLAGGMTLGTEAFLVGYRNRKLRLSLDFKPPLAMRVLGISPFLAFTSDYPARKFSLSVQGLLYRLDISASAPRETFYTFAAPEPKGFRGNWMAESLRGEITVTVWKRKWFKWELVTEDKFEDAGVEFGGLYFDDRGLEKNHH